MDYQTELKVELNAFIAEFETQHDTPAPQTKREVLFWLTDNAPNWLLVTGKKGAFKDVFGNALTDEEAEQQAKKNKLVDMASSLMDLFVLVETNALPDYEENIKVSIERGRTRFNGYYTKYNPGSEALSLEEIEQWRKDNRHLIVELKPSQSIGRIEDRRAIAEDGESLSRKMLLLDLLREAECLKTWGQFVVFVADEKDL